METAIRSLAETGSVAADGQLVIQTPITVSAAEIALADVILLADVPGLSEALFTAISERVRRGAGLAMFLGSTVDAELYNRAFVQPLAPAHSLLPSELSGSVQADAKRGGLSPWKQWNDRHPLLTGLVDPEVGDLAGTQSRAWHRFGSLTAADEVLATMEDGTPALIARRVEAGRVIVINGSADDRWCDLPRRKSFVPLVDRLLLHLQSAGLRRQFTSGETITVALPESIRETQSDAHGSGTASGKALAAGSGHSPAASALPLTNESPHVVSPTGRALSGSVHLVSNRAWLTLSDTTESGFYRIKPHAGSEAELILVVQPGRADSRLDPIEPDKFRAWWSPAEMKIEQPTNSATKVGAVDRRLALEPWLVSAACLCLLAEFFLAYWLCPRMNPALSTSHQRRRGFVAPLREREGATP